MKEKNLDKLSELPHRASRYQSLMERGWNMYDLRFDHNWSRYKKYFKVAYRIITSNIGKSFDTAFSKYCKKVPQMEQYWFIEEFQGHDSHFFIDNNRCIRERTCNKKYKRELYLIIDGEIIYFKSKDYRYHRAKSELIKAKKKQERLDKKLREEEEVIILSIKEVNDRVKDLRNTFFTKK